MKSLLRKFTLCLAMLLAVSLGTARVHALQPEMNDALEALEKARHSDHEHHILHLERAKHHLEEAAHNKHGERVEAIHQINEAIKAARKHEQKRMEEHIKRAIEDIRIGKADARRGT